MSYERHTYKYTYIYNCYDINDDKNTVEHDMIKIIRLKCDIKQKHTSTISITYLQNIIYLYNVFCLVTSISWQALALYLTISSLDNM